MFRPISSILTQQLPALQGKVRRMRESPFNKASGLAKPQPVKSRMAPAPASPEHNADSEEEVLYSTHLVIDCSVWLTC